MEIPGNFLLYHFTITIQDYHFNDMVVHQGWAINACIYQDVEEDEEAQLKGYLCLIWLETQDAWCKNDLSFFGSESEAISYAISLLDRAIGAHSTAPGQLSLF